MLIHLVPVTQGMTREELGGRLETDWVHAGRQAIRADNMIIDPSRPIPPSGVVDVDVWVQTGPVMPAGRCSTMSQPAQSLVAGKRYWNVTSVAISTRLLSLCSSSNGLWA